MADKNLVIGVSIILLILILTFYIYGYQSLVKQQTNFQNLNTTQNLAVGLAVGNLAPDFSLVDPEKGKISKKDFLGKPLFIFFTTTWCVPCQIGAQNLTRYDDEKGGNVFNVLIVFVDESETNEQFLEWKKRFGRSDWSVAKGIEMAQAYKVQYLDTKYVFDKDGVIKWFDTKPLEYSSIKSVLEPLCGETCE